MVAPKSLKKVRLTAFQPGLNKVQLAKLFREVAQLTGSRAKLLVDLFLEGAEVTVALYNYQQFLHELNELGVEATIVP